MRQKLSSNKKGLVAIILILLALPVTVVLALTQQNYINFAAEPETPNLSTNNIGIDRVDIQPGIVTANIESTTPVQMSVLAYDSQGNPINEGIEYDWSISSTEGVGTLTTTQGNISQFIPFDSGCGVLTVTARFGSQVLTKSAAIVIKDGSSIPDCSAGVTPTPFLSITPTSNPVPSLTPSIIPPTPSNAPEIKEVSLIATADSFVRSSKPNRNYGRKYYMATLKQPHLVSYMKFDIRSLDGKEIKKATLKIKVLKRSAGKRVKSGNIQNLKLVKNNWTERGIVYNNRPDPGTPITTFKGNKYGKVLNLDVTDVVGENAGDFLSFSVNSNGNDFLGIYTRNSKKQKPTLIIEYQE